MATNARAPAESVRASPWSTWKCRWIRTPRSLTAARRRLAVSPRTANTETSLLAIRETHGHISLEARSRPSATASRAPPPPRIFYVTSFGNVSLLAACQAGLVNNLNDGMSWGLYPLYFAALGLGVERIGVVKAVYPVVWGLLQIATGPLSDRYGRKGLIASGMIIQAGGI